MTKIESIFQNLVNKEIILKSNLKGCSDFEISLIQRHWSKKLPKEYVSFLKIAGRSAGRFLQCSDIFYSAVLNFKEISNSLLNDFNFESLSNDKIVFFMHQGYVMNFFMDDENNDDPPVYEHIPPQKEYIKVANSFSEYIENHIKDHLRIWKTFNIPENEKNLLISSADFK